MEYDKAPDEIVEIVQEIANDCHQRLDGAKIAVICRETASKKNGRAVMATASKPTPKMIPLLDQRYHFVLCIALDVWDDLDPAQRRALVDHELCHMDFADGDPIIVGHDLEEFAEVINRRGLWRRDMGEKLVGEALVKVGIEIKAPEIG